AEAVSGGGSLEAARDGGAYAAVSLDASGNFSFATTLATDGSADGAHTEHLKGTDKAGNVVTVDVTFTLDSVAPTITVSSPTGNASSNQNITIAGRVTDSLSGLQSFQAA